MGSKRVMGAVQRLENATKKRSIRISAKMTYWPFRDIAKLGEGCLLKLMRSFCALLFLLKSYTSWASVQYYENTSPLGQFTPFPQNYLSGSYVNNSGIVVQNASATLKVAFDSDLNRLWIDRLIFNLALAPKTLEAQIADVNGNLKQVSTTINFNPISFTLKDTDMAGKSPAYRSLFVGTGGAYGLQTIYTQGLYSGAEVPTISGSYSVNGPTQTRNGTFSVGINTIGLSLPDFINLSNPASEIIFGDGLHINEHLSGFKITPWGSDNMAIIYSVVDDVNLAVGLTINQFTSSSQFALQPIPEPSALSLLAVGLGGLVAALRRRR